MAGVKEPLCVNFVKTKCPFCKIGDRIINRGFLKNYLRLDYNFIVVNIKKYYGATKIWWGKVSIKKTILILNLCQNFQVLLTL